MERKILAFTVVCLICFSFLWQQYQIETLKEEVVGLRGHIITLYQTDSLHTAYIKSVADATRVVTKHIISQHENK